MDRSGIRYAWKGDVSLAYEILGDGPVDVMYLQGYLSNVEVTWEHPGFAMFARRLAASARLVVTDRRGLGVSERFTPADTPPIEVLMDDVEAVRRAAGLDRFVLFATGDCGLIATMYAATHPERLSGLVLYGCQPTERRTGDTPWGLTDEQLEWASRQVRDELGSGSWMARTNPSLAGTDHDGDWGGRYERLSLAPGSVYYESKRFGQTDVRTVLATVTTPTLVIHRTGDPEVPLDGGRLLAERIPGARWVQLDGDDHFPWLGDPEPVLDAVEGFVETLTEEEAQLERVLATLLFTDIVGSTQRAVELGDRAWARTLDDHRRIIRALIARYNGREIVTTGDGFLASFDGPARAVRCATDAVGAVRALGLEIRAGCHTGEIELMGTDIGGIAVHVAARVSSLAAPGEVLVSRTVRDLVAGSGIVFDDRGTHELKGVDEPWQLYAVVSDGRSGSSDRPPIREPAGS